MCYCERSRSRSVLALGQNHENGWSPIIAFQIGCSADYIFPFRLRVFQWSHHLLNYWKKYETQNQKIHHFIDSRMNVH